MKKMTAKLLCGILALSLFLCVDGLSATAAKSVYWKAPFDDYKNWYTGVDGSTDGFSYGYMDSPTKFLDFTYQNGVATMFMTGKTLEMKAYQYGTQYGWPWIYYTYEEPLELDLTGVTFEYDVLSQTNWDLQLVLENKDPGDGTEPERTYIRLGQLVELNLPAGPSKEQTSRKGSIDLLDAIRKNYINSLGDLGLLAGNVVKLKGIEIQFINSTASMGEAQNIFNRIQFVKDDSVESEAPVDVSTPETTPETDTELTEETPVVNTETPDVEKNTPAETTESDTWIWAIAGGAVLILAAGVAVLILSKKKAE